MKKFCNICNKEIISDEEFCPYCHFKFIEPVKKVEEKIVDIVFEDNEDMFQHEMIDSCCCKVKGFSKKIDYKVNLIFNKHNMLIDDRAFFQNENICSLTFKEEVEKIGKSAFEECPNLKKVEFLDGFFCIDEYAFKNSSLKELIMKNAADNIKSEAFKGTKIVELKLHKYFYAEGISSNAFDDIETFKKFIVDDEDDAEPFMDCEILKDNLYIIPEDE